MIKDVSKNKTVIFSTHIMQEVQALCDRVVLINHGQIVANDTLSNLLTKYADQAVLVVEFERGVTCEELKAIDGVQEVEEVGSFRFKVVAKPGMDLRSEIFRFAADRHLSLLGLKQEEGSLEGIFRNLTAAV